MLPKRSDSGIQKAARTTSLWLECPLESLSRKILLHFHFSMRDTRSYSLNETHFAWVPRLSRASCEIHISPKLFRASWEDSESIQTDLMDLSLNRNELAMAMLRNTVQPTGEQKRRVVARLHELHCNSGLSSNRTLADRLRRDGAPQSVCKHAMVLTCCACESRATSATEPSDV